MVAIYAMLRQGKMRVRWGFRDNPLLLNIKKYYHQTRIGKLSIKTSDYSHHAGTRLANWITYKNRIFHWKRRFMYPLAFIGGWFYGYVFVSYLFGKNMYEFGWMMTIH